MQVYKLQTSDGLLAVKLMANAPANMVAAEIALTRTLGQLQRHLFPEYVASVSDREGLAVGMAIRWALGGSLRQFLAGRNIARMEAPALHDLQVSLLVVFLQARLLAIWLLRVTGACSNSCAERGRYKRH